MSKPITLDRTKIYKMYYTFCEECGAVSDYADDRKEAEKNRRRHVEDHRRFDAGETERPPQGVNRT